MLRHQLLIPAFELYRPRRPIEHGYKLLQERSSFADYPLE